jgi:MoxR-like ATPase
MDKTKAKKTWFLTRNREWVECEVIYNAPRKRRIKILEGEMKGREKTVHPDQVALGKLYPRVFEAETKPKDHFEFNGRIMLKVSDDNYLVPEKDQYEFQPVTVQIIDSIHKGKNTLLTGPAGTGKTTHVEQIASQIGQKVLRVNLNGETRLQDFIGRVNIEEENGVSVTNWTDGILPTAMRNGMWLILDEVDFAQPEILSLLHPVLERNGKLVLKENKGEEVHPHPSFRIFGTANSIGNMEDKMDLYAGTNVMNEAFKDRWFALTMPYLDAKTEFKVIRKKVPQLQPKFAKQIVQTANQVRQGDGGTDALEFSTRRALDWAEFLALYRDPVKSAELVFLNKVNPDDRAILERVMSLIFKGKTRKAFEGNGNSGSAPVKEIDPEKASYTRPEFRNNEERQTWKELTDGKKGRKSKADMEKLVAEFRQKHPA